MNTPSDKPASTEIARELQLLRETLLLGFGIFFALAGWLFRELERGDHTFSTLTIAAAALFSLLFLRSWCSRIFVNSTLYQSILEASASSKTKPTSDNSRSTTI
jgi:hypothetical protein